MFNLRLKVRQNFKQGMLKTLTAFFICTNLFVACTSKSINENEIKSSEIGKVINEMTNIMVHDITNPPLAARFFSYACLAGYEVVSQDDQRFKSMHTILNEYPSLKKPDTITGYSVKLAALFAMMETAKKMQPSGKLMDAYQAGFIDSLMNAGADEEVIGSSLKYAQAVSKAILAYAKADRYNRISNFARYTPLKKEGSWYPTPPAYIAAIEPYFNTIRPFILDSCTQYKPLPPVPYSSEKNSSFYKQLQQNYLLELTPEKKAIAAFWDCNPFAVEDNGHLLVGLKKISPGAHWLGITGIACSDAGKSFGETMLIHTLVAVGLTDAFISCWDEKYRSNRIRPETAIRNLIDADWQPFLQTPPFPEYLSGHSTISACSATILTHLLGDNFHFTDTVEVRYGLPARTFSSFKTAAAEAAISRFYGGIHYMDAVDEGLVVGEKVGKLVIQKAGKVTP
jgi:hypothetical protein